MGAWGKSIPDAEKNGIRFLGDPSGAFTKALDLTFDSAAIFGNDRSKRYALVVENGKVKSAHVEPDNTGVKDSAAEKVRLFTPSHMPSFYFCLLNRRRS